jgi:glycosidase
MESCRRGVFISILGVSISLLVLLVVAVVFWLLFLILPGNNPAFADELSSKPQMSGELHRNSTGNLENEVLYYIVVDRFDDADPRNNVPEFAFEEDTSDPEERVYNEMNQLLLRHSYDPTHRHMGMYWGGDLEGVIQRLDYLEDLGVTKLVLSPIQDNSNGLFYHPDIKTYLYRDKKETVEDDFYSHVSTPYHGYWTKDWFEIDEHFRSPDDEGRDRYRVFRKLLNEAGKRGIGIILDLTMNQTAPGHISTEPPSLGTGGFLFGESWFADNGDVYRHGERVATHWDPKTGERDPQGWFHEPKIIWDFDTASKELIEEGQISGGMPDLNQDVPAVKQYFFDAAKFWLTFNQDHYPIAGFRLDAVKHINEKFWQDFEDYVLSINPDTILLGEYFGGGYRAEGSINFLQETDEITQYDFNLSEAARRFFSRDRGWDGRTYILRETTLGRKGSYYNYDSLSRFLHWVLNPAQTLEIPTASLDAIPNEEAKAWVTFVENHDKPRLKTYYPDISDEGYQSLIEFQFTARGVPLIMYGTETALAIPYHPEHDGLFGPGGDPFNRPMMIWPGRKGWKEEIYQATRRMAHLRQDYPVLRYGETRYLFPKGASKKEDIFMLREAEGEQASGNNPRILYAYSTEGGEFLLSFAEEGVKRCRVVDTDQNMELPDGMLPVKLKPEEAKVFVLE